MMEHKLSMSRSARITLLLFIDVVFFFVELIVGEQVATILRFDHSLPTLFHAGYAVGSLALVADSFHMLKYVCAHVSKNIKSDPWNSDVMSLVVALYAINVSS
jgi:zinc transporter 1